jgi:DNA topoisomerase-3
MEFAEKLAQEKGIVIPDEAKATSAALSTWIDSNQAKKRHKRRRKRIDAPMTSISPKSAVQTKRSRKRAANVVATATPSAPAQANSESDTPLRIPYGNKEAALKLGARYRAGGWYAPVGVDLAAFGERGWL